MSNFHNKTKGWETVNREIIQDNNLSDRARFLYVYMASKPEDWDFFHDSMKKELGYGEETLRKYLDELIEYGLLIKGEQSNGGRFGATEYTLLDTMPKKPLSENPLSENSVTENFRYGKNPQQRNKEYITDIESIDKRREKIKKEINKERNSNPKTQTAQKEGNTLDYVVPEYKGSFEMWLEYKRQKKQPYKSELSLKQCYNRLVKLSGNNPKMAKAIVEQSIANNYAGLFPLKESDLHNSCLDLSSAAGRKLGVGEKIDENGRRYYINEWSHKTIYVPDDAPPRPSKNHVWSKSGGNWITP